MRERNSLEKERDGLRRVEARWGQRRGLKGLATETKAENSPFRGKRDRKRWERWKKKKKWEDK